MNKVTHFEIVAIDLKRAMDFYTKVFDWRFEKWEDPDMDMEYWMVMTVPPKTPGAINGGLRKEMGTDTKERTKSVNGFVCTVEVASLDDILKKVEAHGGEILMPKMHMAKVGHFASCLDSEGNVFSIMEPEK
ncbi:MAG: Glyoxalase [Parcubacteria group bacterium GW2011_GWA2_43_11]|nr:MAG: Glyoxalase [Parcubacteria group bacterium GW2011_GWC2_42_11]KKS86262.1 MAG: Glyoxalase [Parcubacteria group bacterium GW2011_GWA2_43_11]HCC05587.1 glyoxalase [Patescibacteria group bacterium]